MNICYISVGHISKQRGGVDRVTDVISKELIVRGHKVFLISLWQAIKGDNIYDYQYFLPSQEITSIENQEFLFNFSKKNNIQVIINQAEVFGIFQLLSLSNINVPIISCIHTDPIAPIKGIKDNWDLWKAQEGSIRFLIKSPYYIARLLYQQYTRRKYLKQKYSVLYKGCNAIVLLSDRFKKPFCKISGITDAKKLYAIGNPNSFDEQNIRKISNKEQIVIFVGRLEFSPKRCDRILKIWELVEEKEPGWELVILGDGPDRDMFHHLKEKLNLQRVTFTGTVDPRPYYEKAAISCITSTHEGFSLAASESLQFGAVPIAFGSYEAIYDIIDDQKTGFIIKPFSTKDFSKTILELIKDPIFLKNIQYNIAARKDKFEKSAIVDKWEELINHIC